MSEVIEPKKVEGYEDLPDYIDTGVDYGEYIQKQYKGKKLLHKGLQYRADRNRGNEQTYPAADFGAKTIGMHMSIIPPGVAAGTHRHMSEAIIHILEGKGHSIINGQRYDWQAEDTLFIPPLSWHQHINDDPNNPVRFLAAWSQPLFKNLGLYMVEEKGDQNAHSHAEVRDELLPDHMK